MFETLFKGYDLRGIVPEDLDEGIAENLGKAFASMLFSHSLETHPVLVGRDNRLSSESLAKAFIKGLNACGVNVIDLGEVASPVFYFAIATRNGNGAMITASHNPREYNGFKMIFDFKPMSSIKMQMLKSILESKTFYSNGKAGIAIKLNIVDEYLKHLTSSVKISKKFKVVVDCGNGMGCGVGVKVLQMLGFELHLLYCNSDGTYPNHQPDPHKYSTLQDLQRKVVEVGADLGIAFDGDVDRVGFVDDKGKIVLEDDVQILFARNELKKFPNSSIIYDLRSSMALKEEIEKAGGKPCLARAGRLFIREAMVEKYAVFAGEISGHYFFKANNVYDDGFFAALKLLEYLSSDQRRLSDVMAEIPKYLATPEIRLHVDEGRKAAIVQKVKDVFSKKYEFLDIEGIRIEIEGAWGLLRMSNTEPALSLRFEGKSKEALQKVYSIFSNELDKHGVFLAHLDGVISI